MERFKGSEFKSSEAQGFREVQGSVKPVVAERLVKSKKKLMNIEH
ncbi:hypothetical protein D1BOALGB6SA_7050 [Olavius sp. associated proteobacterium Delta 1]|nr:hypothetical protein D1BOALGB6SA_7050 [Olavius sp. associated proteobacterium Delta 1]